MTRLAPLACGVANLLAALAMATLLAPGTPIVDDVGERERYVGEHLLLWRVGWGTWILAAVTLVWFYVWWRARVGAPRWILAIAFAGIAADVTSELMLIVSGADGYRATAPLAFFLTGAIANGLYAVAGIWLTLASPLTGAQRRYAAAMWSAAVLITVGATLAIPLVTAAATAILFTLFSPWCVWLWLTLR
ncbi:MAG TPA: hypothetical protein VI814_04360 [Candidatus Limnocylindria bacterium]